ncbi:hypothetical protein Ga0100231_000480 [Opitutaceae bacterium TAV4]|uniref:hypothetical protein n=1 Tax=Geminisphaera colitermitum TaxID=1148786 RepID=UPI0005B89427|nr:hypothetical protein [Geminisphaera colitermitum]RRK01330.1 hypothetical protein Ga0100231_000480 [Opitutaceae bacterium TAV4]RRK01634.1 hypothetical protein Ga0100230_007280 [Opitutaceae bacterium TAV3]
MSSRFEAPESESLRKFVLHVIDEMPWRVVAAILFVCFFFFYGATNAALKVTGIDPATIDFPAGPLIGVIASIILFFVLVRVKRRTR